MNRTTSSIAWTASAAVFLQVMAVSAGSFLAAGEAQAQSRARGGGAHVRNASPARVNRAANLNHNVARNANVNRNVNRNINRNVNRNVNVNVHGGYYGGGGCYGCDWDDHDFARGMVAGAVTGAVVGAAVASNHTTVVVPGTVVAVLPSGCNAVAVRGFTYQRCGSIWYQPRYVGTSVEYIIVDAP